MRARAAGPVALGALGSLANRTPRRQSHGGTNGPRQMRLSAACAASSCGTYAVE